MIPVLPKINLPKLTDEAMAILPDYPSGLAAREAAKLLGEKQDRVRDAFVSLFKDGRAIAVRRGKGRSYFLLPIDSGVRSCVICFREFHPVAKQTKTCSYSCSGYLRWQNQDMRKRHSASVRAAHGTPEYKREMSKVQKRLKNTPEARSFASEINRKSWKDPESRARRLISIDEAWSGEDGRKRREKQRKKKLRLWNDPEWRAKTEEAMRTGKRGRFKRAILEMAKAGVSAEVIAQRLELSVEQVKVRWRRSYRDGEIGTKPPDGRKRRQTKERIAHRVACIRRRAEERQTEAATP